LDSTDTSQAGETEVNEAVVQRAISWQRSHDIDGPTERTEAVGAAVAVPRGQRGRRRRGDRQVLHGRQAGEQLPHERQQRRAAAGAGQRRVGERLEARQELRLLLGALQVLACIDDFNLKLKIIFNSEFNSKKSF